MESPGGVPPSCRSARMVCVQMLAGVRLWRAGWRATARRPGGGIVTAGQLGCGERCPRPDRGGRRQVYLSHARHGRQTGRSLCQLRLQRSSFGSPVAGVRSGDGALDGGWRIATDVDWARDVSHRHLLREQLWSCSGLRFGRAADEYWFEILRSLQGKVSTYPRFLLLLQNASCPAAA